MLKSALILLLLTALLVPAAAQTDINVLYIQKTPALNFDSANGGWPLEGSTVTWNAKVKNWGSTAIPSFICEWWLDGELVQTNTITNLAPGEVRNLTYAWAWQQSTHILEFRADTTDVVQEVTEQNNVYSIHTNALTIGSWVEQGVYDWFHAHQIELGDGANSFDDWCYRLVKRWNLMNELSVWPVSPNGIVDRVRVEKVVVVPNGALPLNGGLKTNNPDRYDKTVDLMWGHPYYATDCQPGGYWQVSSTGPFFIDYGEMHELNHARYIVDHYGFDVSQDQSNPNVLVTDQYGTRVAGTSLMPFAAWNVVYYNKSADLMGGSSHYGEYGAGAWNRKAGIRGPRGNQNSPADIGIYLQDLPQNNYFTFVDNSGAPLVGANIFIYRATGLSGWYGKYFDNTPDITLTTDANGRVNLGRCPFSSSGTVTSTYGLSNATFILRVLYNGQEYFTFGEVSDFGIEYWKGNTQNAYHTVTVPWGPTNTATVAAPGQWRQEIYNSKTLSGLVDVKALDTNSVGGFALRMMDRPISSGVGKDNFSCKFTRNVFFNKGTYRLIMHSDDGGRVFVDNVNYIDHWVDGGAIPLHAAASFDIPGPRTVRMDHYDSGALAIAALAIVPPMNTVPGPDEWKVEVFNSTNLTGLTEVAACPKKGDEGFAVDWGELGAGPRTGTDGFSVRFTRDITFTGGTYSFTTASDDGIRLYIDGQLKSGYWAARPLTVDTAQLDLTPGVHRVVVETSDISGPAQVSLSIDHAMPDFEVTFISRTPRYDRYNVSYQYNIDPDEPETGRPYLTAAEQAKQRWPDPGEVVTYTARVRNMGVLAASCDYAWHFDGAQVGSGTTPLLAPGDQFTAAHSMPWHSERVEHLIRFTADPANAVPEGRENNNSREDATNALSIRLHVWQSLYEWFAAHAREHADVVSFEGWAQQNIAHLNALLTGAVYPGTPQGIPLRVRIDDITILPDSAPDPDPDGYHAPADWPWDIRWGFTNAYLADHGGGQNYFESNPAYLSGSDPAFLRALAGQLGLIDYSVLNIEKSANSVQSTIGHPSLLGTSAMTTGAPFFSEHEAYALASSAGFRRGFAGDFLYDLPAVVKLRVLDAYRRPLPGANVKVYQEYPGRSIPAVLRFNLTADSAGLIALPNRSCFGEFTTFTGQTLRDNPFGLVNTAGENGVFFAVVTSGSQTDYQFIEITSLNVAAFLGRGDEYICDLQANIVPEGRPTTTEIYGIKMHSPSLGYAVGASGRILRYDGAGWTSVTSPTTLAFYAVDASPDGGTVMVAGASGRVYVDSGSGWQTRSTPVTSAIYCCAAVSASTMFVGNLAGDLYRSTNAGVNWSKVSASQSSQGAVRSIRFRDSLNGVLIAAKPPAYYTSDGGLTWAPAAGIPADLSLLMGAAFPGPQEAWAVANQGSVLNSSDGGRSWSNCFDFGSVEPWYGIDIGPGGSGWAVGRYHGVYNTTVIKRFEGGRWINEPLCTSGSYNALNGVSLTGPNDAWAVGKQGLILRLASGSAARVESCGSLNALKLLPDGVRVTLSSMAGARISAIFPDCVYLQASDRTSGVKVYTGEGGVLWAPATATGILATENGERVIRDGAVACGIGAEEMGPLAMLERALGGVPNWAGAPNLALLVKVAGRITNAGPGWITIDDGSGTIASDGFPGVKILCDTFAPPSPLPQFAAVTGIATTESVRGTVYPAVRARTAEDIQPIQ